MIGYIAAGLTGLALLAGPCDPPPRPSIDVTDEFTEGPWASQPIDAIYGDPVHAIYHGSETARLTCFIGPEGTPLDLGTVVLTSEGGPGVSRDIPVDIPYVAATYTTCRIDLLGPGDETLANDHFTIYTPV